MQRQRLIKKRIIGESEAVGMGIGLVLGLNLAAFIAVFIAYITTLR